MINMASSIPKIISGLLKGLPGLSFAVALSFTAVSAGVAAVESVAQTKSGSDKVLTAATVIDRCAAKLYNSKGIESAFTVSSGQGSVSGRICIAADKFRISTPQSVSWYDGKLMWVLANGETTLYQPDKEELLETNPLLFVKANSRRFSAIYARVQPAGKYLVVLLPKDKSGDFSRVDITVSKATMLPEKILVARRDGQKMTVALSGLRIDRAFPESTFVYPADKYPGVEINDLR